MTELRRADVVRQQRRSRAMHRRRATREHPARDGERGIAAALTRDDGAPEEQLMRAVIEHAVRALRSAPCRRSRAARREVAEVRAWVLSDDTEWPFAFRSLCDALAVDVEALRQRLRPWLSDAPFVRADARTGARPPATT